MQEGRYGTFPLNGCPKKPEVGSFQRGVLYLESVMPLSEEDITVCYACDAPMNVADVPPYSRVVCPGCQTENRVKKQFGPYTLTRKHAIGGMSSVFVAKDEALDREVALKILSEEFSTDEKRIAAFEEEARLTASFSHPNVVRVLTTGKAFGRLYIAMEFVPGGHFEHRIREQGRVPETEILPLAIQVAEGLKGAQAAGLIHRDVKPGNILLDSEGNAKIVDFGLALVTKGGKAKATEIWATPYYVPPEAVEGQVEDFRADVYAFGATLYHALAGKPPCDQETMATNLLREAKKKIVPLRKAAPWLLEETCSVVDRAMAYEPDHRFASYDDMIAGLEAALKVARGEAVKDSKGVTRGERRAELRLRKKKRMYAAAALSAVCLAGVMTLVFINRPDPKSVEAETKTLTVATEDDGYEDSPREIAARYGAARDALYKGNYEKAGRVFSALLGDRDVEEPTRTWSGLQAVVVAMMDGRMDLAKEFAVATEDHIASQPKGLNPGFVTGASPVVKGFGDYGFHDESTLDLGETGNERFMGYLIAALKNWESGGIDKAVPFFQKIANEPSITGDGVLGFYQETARDYLSDSRSLSSGVLDVDPDSVKDCRAAIEELNRKLTLLKTKGRARFNIRARQQDLAKLEKHLRNRPKPPPQPVERPDVLAEISSLAENYMFVEIVDLVSNLESDPPGCSKRSLLGVSQAALVFLSEMESDLTRRAAVVSLVLKDGTAISSVAVSIDGQLVGKLPTGEVRDLRWTEFPTEQLIELHRELVKSPTSEMERLRRHESAVAFEWLAGDRERALAAAGRLAAESNGFRDRWNSLASGLPK